MSKQITRIICMILTLAMVAAFALVPMASAATATKTIYFDNSTKNWSEVAVYTWNDNGECTGGWPGSVMTLVSGNTYSYEVPTDAVNIIFNNNDNGAQTDNLVVPTDGKNLFNGSVWGIYGQAIEMTYILAGSEALCGTNWDPTNTANQLFDKDGDGVYTITYNNVPAYTYEFKVTDGSWSNSWGKDGGSDNYVLMLGADSNVTINFNEATKLITVDAVPVAGEHVHSYEQSVIAPSCTQSGYTINFCVGCGDSYNSNYTSPLGHSFVGGTCTTCGEVDTGYVPVAQDYYLFGYINGADYGCGDDLANLGAYKFVNNKVTVAFTDDSYVAVKTGDNASFYMTNGWVGEATSATLHKFTDPNATSANKLLISAGQTVTFTLVDNLNGTLTLSYTVDASTCYHPYHSQDGICSTCGTAVEHSFSNGVCTGCGLSDGSYNPFDFYLYGYINGADYATDSATLGEYKFVDGKLTATFVTDSYVAVKEVYPNGKYGPEVIGWYMTDGYLGDVTTATLYRSGDIANPDKLFVPGGVELTFTMSKEGYTIVLSYTTGCAHSYTESVTNATCTANGSKTSTCTKCGHSFTETLYATGHNYVDGVCTACGAKDPNAGGVYYSLVGYINGANYGCEGDSANPGDYKFVNGKLTTTFTQDSYVFVKTSDNTKWYLASAYCQDTTCTFVEGASEKLFVPAGQALTFTLVENADGSITVSYTTAAASTVPTLKLKGPTLEFKDMVKVIAFYTAENTQDVVEMGMLTYSTNVGTANITTAENVLPGYGYDQSNGFYFSASQGINAKYLGDTVYLAIYAKLADGTYTYTKVVSYSPVTYAVNQLNSSSDAGLKQLVAAMLNYGSEAQLFFGHNTGSLANASLTAAQKALPAAYNSSMAAAVSAAPTSKQGSLVNNQGFASRQPAISFEGAFCINYFFTPKYTPDNGITLYYWNAADYAANSVLSTANATGSIKLIGSGTDTYRGDIEGIAAKNLSDAVYVAAVYTNGGTTWTSGVLGYSIGAYCASQISQGATVAALAKATAVYGYHAKQYFG